MTPTDAAHLVARHSAELGTSIWRCADRILRDPDTFAAYYRTAARNAPRREFPELLDAHAVLCAHHAEKGHPADA